MLKLELMLLGLFLVGMGVLIVSCRCSWVKNSKKKTILVNVGKIGIGVAGAIVFSFGVSIMIIVPLMSARLYQINLDEISADDKGILLLLGLWAMSHLLLGVQLPSTLSGDSVVKQEISCQL